MSGAHKLPTDPQKQHQSKAKMMKSSVRDTTPINQQEDSIAGAVTRCCVLATVA